MALVCNYRNRNTKLLCLITIEKQLTLRTMILARGLVGGLLQLEAIRLEETEAKYWEEYLITVFLEIQINFCIERLIHEGNYGVLLEVIPFPLHKLLNEVEVKLLEQSIDDFTLDHQLKVKSG